MTALTEASVRGLLSLDKTVSRENIDRAMHILDPGRIPAAGTPEFIRYGDACRLLGVRPNTLQHFIRVGMFVRAFVKGRTHAVGITLESYLAFASRFRRTASGHLPPAVENGVRFALSRDPSISPESVEAGLRALEKRPDSSAARVITCAEAALRLRVTPQTIRTYVRRGFLKAVRGAGCRNVGVTSGSLLKMMRGQQ